MTWQALEDLKLLGLLAGWAAQGANTRGVRMCSRQNWFGLSGRVIPEEYAVTDSGCDRDCMFLNLPHKLCSGRCWGSPSQREAVATSPSSSVFIYHPMAVYCLKLNFQGSWVLFRGAVSFLSVLTTLMNSNIWGELKKEISALPTQALFLSFEGPLMKLLVELQKVQHL